MKAIKSMILIGDIDGNNAPGFVINKSKLNNIIRTFLLGFEKLATLVT